MTSPRTAKATKAIKIAQAARARRVARLAKAGRGARSAQTAVAAAIGVGLLLHPGEPTDAGSGADTTSAFVVQHVALTVEDPDTESGSGGSAKADAGAATSSTASDDAETPSGESSEKSESTSGKGSDKAEATAEADGSEAGEGAAASTTAASKEAPAATAAKKAPAATAAKAPAATAAKQAGSASASASASGAAPVATGGATTSPTVAVPVRTTPDGRALVDLRRVGASRTTGSAPTPVISTSAPRAAVVPAHDTAGGSVLERVVQALVGAPSTSAIGGGLPAAPPLGALVLAQWALFRRGENPLLNRSPIVNSGGAQRIATGQVIGDVDATDPDRDQLTYSVTRQAAHGTVLMNRTDGTWTYTPNPGYSGPDSFTVTVRDNDPAAPGLGRLTGPVGQAIARSHPQLAQRLFGAHAVPVTITIPGNRAPSSGGAGPVVGVPSAAGVVTGNVGVVDGDGDPLTYGLAPLQGPGRGNVVFGPGDRFTYTPSPAARHAAASEAALPGDTFDSFVVTVSDGKGGVTQVPITVPVLGANERPVATGIPVVDQSPAGVVTGNAAGSVADADRDMLIFGGSRKTAKGTLTVNPDGTFTYTPSDAARHAAAATSAKPEDKADTFDITVSDGHGGRTTIPIIVAIPGVNQDPVAVPAPGAPAVDPDTGAVTGVIQVGDSDHDALYVDGFDGIDIVAGDGFEIDRDPQSAQRTYTYRPGADTRHAASRTSSPVTQRTITVFFSDGHGGRTSVPITVDVLPANAEPVVERQPEVSLPTTDGVVNGSAPVVTDADTDTLTYTGPENGKTPKGSVVVNTDGSFVYTPNDDARHAAAGSGPKTDSFTITVSDGHGGTTTSTVTVPILAANQDPTASTTVGAPNAQTGAVTVVLDTTDGDDDPLTVGFTQPTGGTGTVVRNADGSFTYTPSGDARTAAAGNGPKTDSFTVTVSDGHGGTKTETVTVTIEPAVAVGAVGNLDAGFSATDIEYSADGTRLYVLNRDQGTVHVFDAATGARLTPIQVGVNSTDLAVSPSGDRFYVSRGYPGGGTLTAYSTEDGHEIFSTPIDGGWPNGVELSPTGDRVYVFSDDNGVLLAYDTEGTLVRRYETGARGWDVAISPDGRHAYVSDHVRFQVMDIDLDTGAVRHVATSFRPYGMLLAPDGERLVVADLNGGRLVVMSLDGAEQSTIPVAGNPVGLALTPDGKQVHVVHYVGNGGRTQVVDLPPPAASQV